MSSVEQIFSKHQVVRHDGVAVLPRSLVLVSAIEAGYHVPVSAVEDAVSTSENKGSLTLPEFQSFLSANEDARISADDMADHIYILCPDGHITRPALQKAMSKADSAENGLSSDEVDALFQEIDTDNNGYITADKLLSSLYGEEAAKKAVQNQRIKDKKRRGLVGADGLTEEEREEAQQKEAARKKAAEEEEKKRNAAAEAKRAEEVKRTKEAEAAQGAAEAKKKEAEAKKKEADAKKKEEADKAAAPKKKEKTTCGC